MTKNYYSTQLQAGLGMIYETRILINLWQDGLDPVQLQKVALESGQLPNVSARRLRNIVAECFVPRYLHSNPRPVAILKRLQAHLSAREFEQLLYIYTCRANLILMDFIKNVYWNAYTSGKDTISHDDAKSFVIRANQDGKTQKAWSESTVTRVSGYLPACCADFGLLEKGSKTIRKILPYRIEPRIAVFLAYDLHYSGCGDNTILTESTWELFGMDRDDVLDELKRQALKGWFIIQSAGNVSRIGWSYQNREDLFNAFAKG